METLKYEIISENPERIQAILTERVSRKGNISNYFLQKPDGASQLYCTDYTAIMVINFESFCRLFFITSDGGDFCSLINELPQGRYVINYPTKGNVDDVDALLQRCGFQHTDTFVRMYNTRFKEGKLDKVVYAKKLQSEQIIALLERHFTDYLSYSPDKDEMEQLIEKKCVIVNTEEDKVIGVMVFEFQGKKAYFRIWCDEGKNGLKLLTDAFSIVANKGIKYVYNWINENNKISLSVYKFFGSQPDGLKDYVYLKTIS